MEAGSATTAARDRVPPGPPLRAFLRILSGLRRDPLGLLEGLAEYGDVARARGMTQVARDAGLGRESLYKALAPGAKPRFDTVLRVARALGVRLCARAGEV